MPNLLVSNVLVLCRDAAAAARWAETLAGEEFCVHLGPSPMPELDQFEVILAQGDAASPESGTLGRWTGGEIIKSMVGVVRVGAQGHADVRLPPDATPREIELACRLLAEIVRLRRALRSRAENESRLARQALLDPLTGLPNRRAWDEAISGRMSNPCQRGGQLCVALFDLDHFKEVNDACGHAVGDDVLRMAGAAVHDGLRQEDFVARLGGDEFGLLLRLPDPEAAAAVIDRVRRQVPERLVQSDLPAVTASGGYWLATGSSAPLPSPAAAFELADSALREAKQTGRDRTIRSETS